MEEYNNQMSGQRPGQELLRQNDALVNQNRLLCIIAALCAALLVVSIVCMAVIVPPAARFFGSLSDLSENISLTDIADTLEEAKLLISESRDGVQQAAEKIDDFDVDKLNDTIESLNTIIEPLANLFGKD